MDYQQAAEKAIILASKHTTPDVRSSAGICLQDAMACMAKGKPLAAYIRAMDSLRYSVGVCAKDYSEASSIQGVLGVYP